MTTSPPTIGRPPAGVPAGRRAGDGGRGTVPDDVMTADRGMARLLRLLADEAPAEAVDRLSRNLLEATAGSADRDLVLTALARAGRIRELLVRRKHREKETQALYETARDLASLRDGEEVLKAIVHRTRQLLGTDAAYLALADPATGEVYMRVTLGTVTRAIETVRQGPGQGIGGRIMRTGKPYATANYLRDRSLDRQPSVTDAVAEDGIVGIIGAPLRVGGDVVGALFGANRYERSFEPSEIALLSSLADHAAIVIDNSRLFARAEETARELRAANDQLLVQGQALERGTAAHGELMRTVLRRADLLELIDAIAGMLDGALAMVHASGEVRTGTRRDDDHELASLLAAVCLRAASVEDPPRAGGARRLDVPIDASCESWTVPVQAGPDTFGHLVLVARRALTEADVRVLERSAQTAALLLLMERQVSVAAS